MAFLRPYHGSYRPTTSMLPTNLQLHYNTYWPPFKTGKIPTTEREQFTRSNAPTFRLPTLVRLAETLPRDWLNTNKPQEMVMLTITLLYMIKWQTTTGVYKTKTEDRRPKTEDRRPKNEDRKTKTEKRRPKNEDPNFFMPDKAQPGKTPSQSIPQHKQKNGVFIL